MLPEPTSFTSEDAEAAADAEGMADIAAGRFIPHEEVVRWLDTWGTDGEIV